MDRIAQIEEMGRVAQEAGEVRIAPLVELLAEGGLAMVDTWYRGFDAARGIVYIHSAVV